MLVREVAVVVGGVARADGSGRFSHGLTSALAAVYGPAEPRLLRNELMNRAFVEVNFKTTGKGGYEEREVEAFVRGAVEGAIIATMHPRTSISVAVQQLHDDGSTLAAALNATVLALLDAGVPLQGQPVAIATAIAADGSVRLDPDADTEAQCRAKLTFALLGTSVLVSHTQGRCSVPEMEAALAAAQRAAPSLAQLVRRALAPRAA